MSLFQQLNLEVILVVFQSINDMTLIFMLK